MAEEEDGEDIWSLPQEVEVLESIYPHELLVHRGSSRSDPWEISITLYPATAEDQESQYVRVTLQLSVPPEYPKKSPNICMQNPRGLSDEHLLSISQNLKHVADSGLGGPILYELLVKAKEILTENNIPYGECVICQYGFQANEAFTKTSCYHYFHSHCLARYARHLEEEMQSKLKEQEQNRIALPQQVNADVGVQCPVCREPLTYDLEMLESAPPPNHPLEVYNPDKRTIQHQRKLRKLFEKQQAKGGIIDPEAERNRYFISLQKPSVDENSNGHVAVGGLSESELTSEKVNVAKGTVSSADCGQPSEELLDSTPGTNQQHSCTLKDDHRPLTSTPRSSTWPSGKAVDHLDKAFTTNGQHRGWPRGARRGFRGHSHFRRPPSSTVQEPGMDGYSYVRGPPVPKEFIPNIDKRAHGNRGGHGRAYSYYERRRGSPGCDPETQNGATYSYGADKTAEPQRVTEKQNSALSTNEYPERRPSRGQNHCQTQGDGRWEKPRFRGPAFRPQGQQLRGTRETPTDLAYKDSS
ncbi:E3 ubiquitin-protein ligase RNF25 isoform X1 [Pleurodeles waltl]